MHQPTADVSGDAKVSQDTICNQNCFS